MLLDKDGKAVEPKAEPHKFGMFRIPDDARLSISRGIEVDQVQLYKISNAPYWNPNVFARDEGSENV